MPRYETHVNRRDQNSISNTFASVRGYSCKLVPDREDDDGYDTEFSLDDVLVSIAEVKRRHCKRLRYRTFKIDKAKIDKMLASAERLNVTCGVIVQFDDGIVVKGITRGWLTKHAVVTTFLRTDRPGETVDAAYAWSNTLWVRLT